MMAYLVKFRSKLSGEMPEYTSEYPWKWWARLAVYCYNRSNHGAGYITARVETAPPLSSNEPRNGE
jgi:hypothetical protein